MSLTNQDIIFLGLMGSNSVAAYQRSQLVQNELSKHVLPNIPFLPVLNENKITNTLINPTFRINEADGPTPEAKQFFPLSFSFEENGTKFLFPYEPMINVSSGNNIIKRNVAKQGKELVGTIKERWNRKDFDIQVTGVLMGSVLQGSVENCYPKAQMKALFDYLKFNKEIYVYSEPLAQMGITKIVVEDYSFPFTKGENVQAYDIKLVSDFAYNLLLKK
jgi:Domain of unknown function (DUF6046)